MDKEVNDKLWKDLKRMVIIALEEREAKAGIKVGRDRVERDNHIDRTAGMMYGHLVEEVRVTVKQYIIEVNKRAEKFS